MSFYSSFMARTKSDTFRKVVPEDVREHFGRREFKHSLKKFPEHDRPIKLVELHRLYEEQIEAARAGDPIGAVWQDKVRGIIGGAIEASKAPANASPLPSRNASLRLSTIFDHWKLSNTASITSVQEWERAVRYFTQYLGDLPVDQISRAHLLSFRDALRKLPTNFGKKFPGKTIPQVLAAIEGTSHDALLSAQSINKYIVALSSIFEKAVTDELIRANPAKKLKLDVRHSKDDRLPLSEADLLAVFSHPVFTEKKMDDARYWAFYLALYTGSRLEEIGQLQLQDIHQKDGIWCLNHSTEDGEKRFKTAASIRTIPIHRDLIELGLLEYVTKLHNQGRTRLFPGLVKDSKGKYTTALSKRLNGLLRAVKITNHRKTFHSLRHTFKDLLRQHDIPEEHGVAILGHSDNSTSRKYGSGVSLAKLNESIQRLKVQSPTAPSHILNISCASEEALAYAFKLTPKLTVREISKIIASGGNVDENILARILQLEGTRLRTGEIEPNSLMSETGFLTQSDVADIRQKLGSTKT